MSNKLISTKIDKELDAFVPLPTNVTTVTGEVVTYPPVGFGVETRILRMVGGVLERIPPELWEKLDRLVSSQQKQPKEGEDEDSSSSGLWGGMTNPKDLFELFGLLCELLPKEITGIVALIVRQEPEWVEENLDIIGVAEVVLPFFSRKWSRLSQLIGRVFSQNHQVNSN